MDLWGGGGVCGGVEGRGGVGEWRIGCCVGVGGSCLSDVVCTSLCCLCDSCMGVFVVV